MNNIDEMVSESAAAAIIKRQEARLMDVNPNRMARDRVAGVRTAWKLGTVVMADLERHGQKAPAERIEREGGER